MFAQLESALKAAIQAALGSSVNEVLNWREDALNDPLLDAPAVYMGFHKGTLHDENKLKGRWHVYLVTESSPSEEQSSASTMMTSLLSALHGLDMGQADGLTFKRVKSRPDLIQNRTDYQCHQLEFWLLMTWPDQVVVSSLDDFLRYHGQAQTNDSEQVLISADGTLANSET